MLLVEGGSADLGPKPWHERAFLIPGIEGEVTALRCDHTECAATTQGVYCWGPRRSFMAGAGPAVERAVKLEGMPASATGFVESSGEGVCVLDPAQRVWCYNRWDKYGDDAPALVLMP